MLAKLNSALLLVAVGLLLFIAFKPTPVSVVQGRFQPTERWDIALDTERGQACHSAEGAKRFGLIDCRSLLEEQ
jgi:hypothetical protein